MIHRLVGGVEDSVVKATQVARMKGYCPDVGLGQLTGRIVESFTDKGVVEENRT